MGKKNNQENLYDVAALPYVDDQLGLQTPLYIAFHL